MEEKKGGKKIGEGEGKGEWKEGVKKRRKERWGEEGSDGEEELDKCSGLLRSKLLSSPLYKMLYLILLIRMNESISLH